MVRAALAAAPRVAAGIVRAAAWVTRVIVLPLLASLLERARPHLRRAWISVRNFVLRHCNARDITWTVMVASPFAAYYWDEAGRLPQRTNVMVAAGSVAGCAILLRWLTWRGQRKWREHRPGALNGGGEGTGPAVTLAARPGFIYFAAGGLILSWAVTSALVQLRLVSFRSPPVAGILIAARLTLAAVVLLLPRKRDARRVTAAVQEDHQDLAGLRGEVAALEDALAAMYRYAGEQVPEVCRNRAGAAVHLSVVPDPDGTDPQGAVA